MCAALGALVDQDSTVLCCPTRSMMPTKRRSLSGAVGRYPSVPTLRDGRFTFSSRQLEDAWVPGTDVILLNTPWNPVGTVLTHEELVDIMGFAERNGYAW